MSEKPSGNHARTSSAASSSSSAAPSDPGRRRRPRVWRSASLRSDRSSAVASGAASPASIPAAPAWTMAARARCGLAAASQARTSMLNWFAAFAGSMLRIGQIRTAASRSWAPRLLKARAPAMGNQALIGDDARCQKGDDRRQMLENARDEGRGHSAHAVRAVRIVGGGLAVLVSEAEMDMNAIADAARLHQRRERHPALQALAGRAHDLAKGGGLIGDFVPAGRLHHHLELIRPVLFHDAVGLDPALAKRRHDRLQEPALAPKGAERVTLAPPAPALGQMELMLEGAEQGEPGGRLQPVEGRLSGSSGCNTPRGGRPDAARRPSKNPRSRPPSPKSIRRRVAGSPVSKRSPSAPNGLAAMVSKQVICTLVGVQPTTRVVAFVSKGRRHRLAAQPTGDVAGAEVDQGFDQGGLGRIRHGTSLTHSWFDRSIALNVHGFAQL